MYYFKFVDFTSTWSQIKLVISPTKWPEDTNKNEKWISQFLLFVCVWIHFIILIPVDSTEIKLVQLNQCQRRVDPPPKYLRIPMLHVKSVKYY